VVENLTGSVGVSADKVLCREEDRSVLVELMGVVLVQLGRERQPDVRPGRVELSADRVAGVARDRRAIPIELLPRLAPTGPCPWPLVARSVTCLSWGQTRNTLSSSMMKNSSSAHSSSPPTAQTRKPVSVLVTTRVLPHISMARPTMRDVAGRAGVAVVTVSRVVNGEGYVREETANRIRAAITELGFHRDEVARALRPGRNSLTIGLLLGDLTNSFYATIARAAVEVANKSGFAVLLSTVDEDPEVEQRAVGDLIGRRVAGLVIVPDQRDHAFLDRATGHGRMPVVFVDRPAAGTNADAVLFDNEGGGRLATRHLIEQGHRRIAILVAPSYYTTGRRLRGYRKALREAGITVDERLVVALDHGSASEAADATHQLLRSSNPPTAVFSTTNFLTEGVIRATQHLPYPIALVGFDDFRMADLLSTPVTVVATDAADLGRRAARLLLTRIDGATDPVTRTVLPVRLIPRGSGEVPPPA